MCTGWDGTLRLSSRVPHLTNRAAPRRERWPRQIGALLVVLAATSVARAEAPLEELARLASLTEANAREARPIRVEGTVAYSDPAWRLLFLTNGREAIFIDPPADAPLPEPGERVEAEGVTAFSVGIPGLAKVRLRSLGKADLSAQQEGTIHERPLGARFAKIRGSVRRVLEGSEHDTLEVVSGGTRHILIVRRGGSSPLPVRGAEIDATGVLIDAIGPFRAIAPSTLWLASRASLQVTTPEPDTSRLLLLSLDDARRAWHRGEVSRLVRVRGTLAEHLATDRFVLADSSGRLEVQCEEATRLSQGIEFLMTGFLAVGSRAPLLEDVTYRAVGGSPFAHGATRTLPRIESLKALRALSAHEAEQGRPLTVLGTVTFLDLDDEKLFLQDGSTAVYVHPAPPLTDVRPGDLVRVTGRSAPGSLAPIIVEPEIVVLKRDAWPRASPTDDRRLRTSQDDCLFVEFEARVRSMTRQHRRTLLRTDTDGLTVDVVLPPKAPRPSATIVDARVRIWGVVSSIFNWRGELARVEIGVSSPDHITIVEPASESPFSGAPVAARDVLRPLGETGKSRRVRVRAVVTAAELPGTLFVRDETSPLRVSLTERMPLQPGDEVEVAGFPVPGPRTPGLEDAMIRIVSRGDPPAPKVARLDSIREGLHDSDLVTLDATLLDSVHAGNEWRFILQANETVFDAVLTGATSESSGPIKGSRLRIQGIAIAHERIGRAEGGFTLQLRSSSDIVTLSNPPFWTATRARSAIGVLCLVLVTGAAWTFALRRRVRRQTSLIREQAGREQESDRDYRDELEALIWQRTRELEEAQNELVRRERLSTLGRLTATVSHELRNPLGTIRGSLFVIGNSVRGKSPALDRALDRAERNVLRCDTIIDELLEYTRGRDLLPQATRLDTWLDEVLDEIPIPAGLRLDRNLSSGAVVRIDRGRIQRLVVNLVSNACEALTASASHGADRLSAASHDRLEVAACLRRERVLISVSDNGPGIAREDWVRIFEPFHSTKSFGIGLGLAIVQQIAEQHGGGIEVESEPGRETTFTLWLPSTLVERNGKDVEPDRGGVA